MVTGIHVANVAEQAVAARRKGLRNLTIGKVNFDLTESGMCARFIRECHEAALGAAEQTWPYRGWRALELNDKLRAAALGVHNRVRGDVICFSGGQYGHAVIYLGEGMVAENTISGNRGTPREPGTKITPLADVGHSRIIGSYRPMPIPLDQASSWAIAAQQWVKEHRISDGTRPRDAATREEVWLMLMETAAEITSR